MPVSVATTTGTHGALTRQEYDALVAAGAFEGRRVELLEGEVRDRVAKSPAHRGAVVRLQRWLTEQMEAAGCHVDGRPLRDVWAVVTEQPFAMGDSEPEPDLALAPAEAAGSLIAHPTWARLVVEIAATRRRDDLERKPAVYAAAGVPDYWVVDLRRRVTLVHTQPDQPVPGAVGVWRPSGPRSYGPPLVRPFAEPSWLSVPDMLSGTERRALPLHLVDLLA